MADLSDYDNVVLYGWNILINWLKALNKTLGNSIQIVFSLQINEIFLCFFFLQKMQLLKLNVPSLFMLVALDEGPGPPIKYQYAELNRLYSVVSVLVRCCDVSSRCLSSNVSHNLVCLISLKKGMIWLGFFLQRSIKNTVVKQILIYFNRCNFTNVWIDFLLNRFFWGEKLLIFLWLIVARGPSQTKPIWWYHHQSASDANTSTGQGSVVWQDWLRQEADRGLQQRRGHL